jgi:hypothetical protein
MPNTSKRDEPVQYAREERSVRSRQSDPAALARLLDEWMHGDETEQRETFEILQRALNDGRPDGYKLFP